MSKARIYGSNKSYVKSGTGDRILIKTRTYFARGGNKPQRSAEAFYKHLTRVNKDQEDLQSPYTFIALPRRGGKMAYIIQKAIQQGGAIAVTREETKKHFANCCYHGCRAAGGGRS